MAIMTKKAIVILVALLGILIIGLFTYLELESYLAKSAADTLRQQAIETQQRAHQRMANNIQVLDVQALVYPDENNNYVAYYLVIHVSPAVMAEEDIDMKKVILSYSAQDIAIPGVQFEKITNILNENATLISRATGVFGSDAGTKAGTLVTSVQGACTATAYNIMKILDNYNWLDVGPFVSPVYNIDLNNLPDPVTLNYMIEHRDPSRYTMLWEYCNGKDDVSTLADGQTAYILYALPKPAHSSDHIKVELHVTGGWSAPMDLIMPALSQAGLKKVL
jgi:archaellin